MKCSFNTVPPSSARPVRPAPRSYAEAACKKVQIQQPATPAAPLSCPPSCKGRRIPDYTSHGPSRRQLLIDVGDHAKDANLTTLFKDLSSDILSRQGLRVKVLGIEIAYNGYSVPTDKVPSEHDTDILRGAVTAHFKTHYKFMPWVLIMTWITSPNGKRLLRHSKPLPFGPHRTFYAGTPV
ncbi:hypothetical protein CVT25_002586 [Psilocybe cyanescens]|uniref:Uncharacterized protein n=1 Tax=Psilocybe cyanescens TaxID=93625 RepID=A0A409XK98_PSICY|nr:hypothetical protein CVT25_002586 [Psilocybe cyanescens]